jgi:hypothetical protein
VQLEDGHDGADSHGGQVEVGVSQGTPDLS